ncbi:hypothetical protein [Silanimonas sp.]|jgi:hypothetical protein|uniref:hypothetical protein n=1 Tax=Silanimonas sp. TaxID=1929290 RepID=UPI0022BF5194|nr:hypothetical protein [Silanimonas sp.]MCZ8114340.1 hypothetical protein [Silanimonas sp.]
MRLILRVALPAVALGVVALAWWLLQRAPTTVASPSDVEASTTQAPASTPNSMVDEPNPATQTTVALPPRDIALDRLWSALQRPAQAGDAGAACRLAIETLRCVGAVRMAAVLTASPAAEPGELQTLLEFEVAPSSFGRAAGPEDPRSEAAFGAMKQRANAAARHCEGLSPERAFASLALLRAAALAGQPDAQAIYAAGEGWFLSIPGGMGRPEFEQWRREAPMVVARMLDEGHPEAPGLLAGAYSGHTWLGGLYDTDLERATAYLLLNARLMGKPEIAERQLAKVPAETTARARQQAEALYARHYAGRALGKATFYLGAGVRILQSDIFDGEAKPAPCAPRPAAPPAVDNPVDGR